MKKILTTGAVAGLLLMATPMVNGTANAMESGSGSESCIETDDTNIDQRGLMADFCDWLGARLGINQPQPAVNPTGNGNTAVEEAPRAPRDWVLEPATRTKPRESLYWRQPPPGYHYRDYDGNRIEWQAPRHSPIIVNERPNDYSAPVQPVVEEPKPIPDAIPEKPNQDEYAVEPLPRGPRFEPLDLDGDSIDDYAVEPLPRGPRFEPLDLDGDGLDDYMPEAEFDGYTDSDRREAEAAAVAAAAAAEGKRADIGARLFLDHAEQLFNSGRYSRFWM